MGSYVKLDPLKYDCKKWASVSDIPETTKVTTKLLEHLVVFQGI